MKRFILAALAAAMLLGCGGGGGGSENTGAGTNTVPGPIILNAAFEPKEAQTSIFENQTFRNSYNNLELFITTLNVDGIDPTKVFPVITADKPIFSRLDIGVSNLSRKLEMSVQLSTQIPAGIHTGKVTVTLYKDAAKTQAYTLSNGGVFLYTINVDPELVITVKIDGVIQAQRISSSNTGVVGIDRNTIYWGGEPAGPPAAFRLKPGQIIELTSSIPVIWYGPRTAGIPMGNCGRPQCKRTRRSAKSPCRC